MTPCYMCFSFVPRLIYDTLGDRIKIVVVLRSPVERTYSQYQHEMAKGSECLSFERALGVERKRSMGAAIYLGDSITSAEACMPFILRIFFSSFHPLGLE